MLRVVRYISFLSIAFLLGNCADSEQKGKLVGDAQREQAVHALQHVMKTQDRWVKVHAAEYLLQLGYPAGVQQEFEKERELYQNEPQYRVGIWRVLARASVKEEDRQVWLNHILKGFTDKDGPDRIHCAETLAKLKVPLMEKTPKATEEVLSGKDSILIAFTLWGAAIPEDKSAQPDISQLLRLITSDNEDLQRIAAYALRHLGVMEPASWNRLKQEALSASDTSSAAVYLLSAAHATAPESVLTSDDFAVTQLKLLAKATSQVKADRYELCEALAQRGSAEQLGLLRNLLNSEDPIRQGIANTTNVKDDPVNVDIKAAAAHAILRIDRRQPYALALGDWVVIALYAIGMLLIGWYYATKTKSADDYFLGGRSMNPIAVGLSLFATLLSALSYLSYPGEMVKYGPMIFMGMLSFPIIYYVAGWWLIPKFMTMNVTSAYEILELKLGKSVRLLAIFFFLSLRFLWMSTIIYATVDTTLYAVFGIDPVYTPLVCLILAAITIVYTSMGGLKAVVLTDVVQTIILLGGVAFTLTLVSMHFGSVSAWFPNQWPAHWSEFQWQLNPNERMTVGNAFIMVLVWYICTAGSDQMAIQRYLANKDTQSARKTFGISLITNFTVQSLLALVGLAMLAYFTANPQYLSDGETVIDNADNLFPRFILVGMPVGVSGLVIAGLLAAAMSSLSSGLNSVATVIYEDLINPSHKQKSRSTAHQLKSIRNISAIVGITTAVLSIFIGYVQGNLLEVVIKVVNLFVAPLFVLFFLALFIPFATARGTVVGGIVSVLVAIAIAFFKVFGIEVLWIMPLSFLSGAVTGSLAGLLDKKRKKIYS